LDSEATAAAEEAAPWGCSGAYAKSHENRIGLDSSGWPYCKPHQVSKVKSV